MLFVVRMKTYDTRNEMIADLLKPGMRVAELGVWKGEFAKEILKTKPCELVLVDPWKGMMPSGNADGNNVQVANLDQEYWRLCREYQGNRKVKLIRALSWDALEGFPDNYFNAIYIDSSHDYLATKKELLMALRKVKEGGYIMGHDYGQNFAKTNNKYDFGVQRACDEFCDEFFYEVNAIANDGCRSFCIYID